MYQLELLLLQKLTLASLKLEKKGISPHDTGVVQRMKEKAKGPGLVNDRSQDRAALRI